MKSVICPTLLLLLLPLVSAHFQLLSPKVRGYDEDSLVKFPCGGQDTVGTRSPWPMTGGNIQLNMEHDQSKVEVVLALGNDPGDNYNIVLQPTIQEQGIGHFCFKGVTVPASLGIKDGQNATIQVVSNGDPDGGLFNCADITFQTSASAGDCNNGTGVKTTGSADVKTNANGTDVFSASSSSASGSSASSAPASSATGSPSGTAPAPAATSSHAAAPKLMEMGGWGFLGAAAAAMALL